MSSSPNEVLEIRSPVSLEETMNILRRRKGVFLQAFVAVVAVGILVTASTKPVYRTWARLLVPAGSRSVSLVDSANPIAAMVAAAQPDSLATQLQILQSRPFLTDAREEAGVQDRPDVVPATVRIEALEESSVIQITVEGGDRQGIADYANAIVDLHLERTDLLATTGLKDTLTFVRKEKDKARRDLVAAEQRLVQFRKEHRIVQLAAEQEAQAKEYVALESQVRELESQILTTRTQIQELRARLARAPIDVVHETTKENPRAARLQERLDELSVQREALLTDFKPTSSRVKALDDQLAALRAQREKEPDQLTVRTHAPNPERPPLQAELVRLEAQLRGHEVAFNAARARLQTRKALVDNLGPWEVEQTRLIRERDQAQAADTQLAERLRNLEIQVNARVRTARILERAFVPGTPVLPRKADNLVIAVAAALCFGIGMAFLAEYLDDRVNTPADFERFSYLPPLATVPKIGSGEASMLSAMPVYSHVAEAYRALRSSIMFAALDQPVRRLLVTSANKSEGKTLTSVNLATAMALDGKRVILVDADLRRPHVHATLQLPGAPGLSEVLVGVKTVEEVLHPTDTENFRAICGGAIPPNPAELLGSPAFDRLMADLEAHADVIIFDSPPCVPVTDPLLLAARMDGVVLVVQVGQTRRAAIRHVEEQLRRARARVLGVVFNRFEQRKHGYYHHYGYGYYGETVQVNGHGLKTPGLNGNGANGHAAHGKEAEDDSPMRELPERAERKN